jgi:hypothetical protein
MLHNQIAAIALGLALAAAAPAGALTVRYGPSTAYDGEVDQTDANIATGSFPAGRTNWGPDWQNWAEATGPRV